MNRVHLSGGRWFDESTADRWDEATWFNGQNHVSKATGSQWDHERLYRTRRGVWVLHGWSQWQGSASNWTEYSEEQARGWLLDNEQIEALQQHFPAALEQSEI